MSLNRLNREKDKIYNVAEKSLTSGFTSVNTSLFDLLMDVVNSLDSTDGSIADTERNTRIMSQLDDIVRTSVAESGYRNKVNDYLSNFDRLTNENIQFHKDFNKLPNVSAIVTSAQRSAIDTTINSLTGQGMDRAFTIPITESLETYIKSGTTQKHVEENLRLFIKGNDEKLGLLERHVNQVARDGIMQFDGAVQREVQKEYKLNAIGYLGSLIEDSRKQCVHWVNDLQGVIMRDELAAQIRYAERYGTGWIQGTTEETFIINRGGYNCRHTATPINV